MIKEPRLRFTEEERADPALGKPIRKAEKAAAKADKAQAKIPKKQVKRTVVDPKTGKVTTKLVLEDKPRPPSKLSHSLRDAPGNAVAGKIHQEIQESEDDNVGVESAHKSEEAVESGVHLVQEGYRSHKLKPYRKAAQAERQLEKANINVLYSRKFNEADKKYENRYPLIEDWHWTRDDCIRAIQEAGLPLPGKSSCFFCPSMKRDEVETLKRQHPDLYRRALAIEENAMPHLKTVKGLGRNYAWKERYGME